MSFVGKNASPKKNSQPSEDCYIKMWDLLIVACRERNLVLQPEVFHIDFEYAMHSAILTKVPNSTISCCRFHLGQSWWRKIQAVGLSVEYKEKSSEIGKWLTIFFWTSIFTNK
jgi:ABC-type microcin C transport system permease subunit YejB